MSHRSRKIFAGTALALALGTGLAAVIPAEAEAQWRRRHRGPAVVAGIIGGLAVGSIIAGARRSYAYPYYGHGYGYDYGYGYPAASYVPGPSYYAPACYWANQRVQIDPWTYQVRRVRVCN